MSKINSKKAFIEKLNFYLTLHFSDGECTNILNDYKEWFENETLQGKEENEICFALGEPKKIVKNLIFESSHNTNFFSLFLHNSMLQMLCLIVVHFFINLFVLKYCNNEGLDYFPFAICSNFLYFFIGITLVKKGVQNNHHLDRNNLLISSLVLLIIVCEIFILPVVTYPYSGKICIFIMGILIFMLLCSNLYFTIKKNYKNNQYTFLTVFHLSGIITILFYIMNQLHMFYDNIDEYRHLVIKSICLYIQVIILYIILHKTKLNVKKEKL